MPDFVKTNNDEFATQLENHHSALVTHGPALGFSASEITVADNDAKYMRHIVTQQQQALEFSQGYTRFLGYMRTSKDTATMPVFTVPASVPASVLVGIETRFRKRAEKAKSVSGVYNKDMGEQLRIVAPESSSTLGLPPFSITLAAGHPVISWTKGSSDGVDIWKDDGKGGGFHYLGRDNKSPFADKSDLPLGAATALWKYKLIYVVNDEPVGDYSAVQEVTVKGV